MLKFNPPGDHAIGGRWDLSTSIASLDGAPLDLTGSTVTAMIQSGAPGHEVTVRPATPISFGDQTNAMGQVTITFLPRETAQMFPGPVRYEVKVSFDAANADTVAMGVINAIKTVL